jgi:lipoyl(octanoyl) transferase
MQTVIYQNLGQVEYKRAWDYQEELFQRVLASRIEAEKAITKGYLLFCEHPHVYTLGKSGTSNNLLISEPFLKQINATFFQTNRGGDITYHGPGQIVAYPIFDLEAFGVSLKDYIHLLEEAIILTLKHYGITATRLEGATGVWLDVGIKGSERKICAIGVRASRFVTMHGLAFNVNTNLDYFNHINPCGFVDKGVTSLQKELGKPMNFSEVQGVLLESFVSLFNLGLIQNIQPNLKQK